MISLTAGKIKGSIVTLGLDEPSFFFFSHPIETNVKNTAAKQTFI